MLIREAQAFFSTAGKDGLVAHGTHGSTASPCIQLLKNRISTQYDEKLTVDQEIVSQSLSPTDLPFQPPPWKPAWIGEIMRQPVDA